MHGEFAMIEDPSKLAAFFNRLMGGLSHLRMFCAPDTFHPDPDTADYQDAKFCDFCRYEAWTHAVVGKMREWDEELGRYLDEFNGSWKYYAAAEKLNCVRKGYADESFGYENFTIVSFLKDEGFRDIVRDTLPPDLRLFRADIIASSRVNVMDGLRKAFGDKVEAFVEDEGGMRPMTAEDGDLLTARRMADGEADAKRLDAVAGCVSGMYQVLGNLRWDEDNVSELKALRKCATALLDLRWGDMMDFMRRFS